MRFPMLVAATLNLALALLAGVSIAFACHRSSAASSDELVGLLVFFVSLASVFGGAGAYLSCRHIQGRAPLWAVATAIGTFGIVLPLASNANVAPVIYWIAGLAGACALIATSIAGTIASAVNSHREAEKG